MRGIRTLAAGTAVCLLGAAGVAWAQARPRMQAEVAQQLTDRVTRPPGRTLWVAGTGADVERAFRTCGSDLLGSRAPAARRHELVVVLATDHLDGVAVSPGPAAPDGSLPPTDPVAVLVAHDLDTGEDLSGAVAVTRAGATCWSAALARVAVPRHLTSH